MRRLPFQCWRQPASVSRRLGWPICWATAFPDHAGAYVSAWCTDTIASSRAWKRLEQAGDQLGEACERALAPKEVRP